MKYKVWRNKKFAYMADTPDKPKDKFVGESDNWIEARAIMLASVG